MKSFVIMMLCIVALASALLQQAMAKPPTSVATPALTQRAATPAMGLLGRVAGRLRPKRKLNIPVIEVGSVLPAVEVEVVPPNATTEGAFLSCMYCTALSAVSPSAACEEEQGEVQRSSTSDI